MLADSVGHTCHVVQDEAEWNRQPVVPLITESGDVTVHLGCTLERAPQQRLVAETLEPFEVRAHDGDRVAHLVTCPRPWAPRRSRIRRSRSGPI